MCMKELCGARGTMCALGVEATLHLITWQSVQQDRLIAGNVQDQATSRVHVGHQGP